VRFGLGLVGNGPSNNAPIVANQAFDFGNLTKASAGGIGPVNTGQPITSASIDSGDASSHWQVSSAGVFTPSATGDSANLNLGPYTLGCTFTNASGSDTATITITILANSYSVATMAQLKTASADIGTASGGARTVYCRSGSYAVDSTAIQARSYVNRVTFTKHSGALPIFSQMTIHTSLLVTIDGLTFYSQVAGGALIGVAGPSVGTIIQNCEFYGDTISPTGNYASAAPVVPEYSVFTSASVGYPSDLSILNNTIHDVIAGVQVGCDGALRIEGNKIENTFSDGIKITYRAANTSVKILDNTVNGIISNGTDFGNPHGDLIQFIGAFGGETTDFAFEIGRNILINKYSRAFAQGIFADDMDSGTYFFVPNIYGNLILNGTNATCGIRVQQAKNARIIGNTVARHATIGGTGPGIWIGETFTSGTHDIRNNVADNYNLFGSYTTTNNVTTGSGGATIAYTTAYDGPTFAPLTVADAKIFFNMKGHGPLDVDNSGGPSLNDVGAVGSGYVTWATTQPGNDGSVNTSYENSGRQFMAGKNFITVSGTRQAQAGQEYLNEAP
jgi:hypothetical protein